MRTVGSSVLKPRARPGNTSRAAMPLVKSYIDLSAGPRDPGFPRKQKKPALFRRGFVQVEDDLRRHASGADCAQLS